VKSSKSRIQSKVHRILPVRFEEQDLTSYAGLMIFQALFQRIGLKEKLRARLSGGVSPAYGRPVIALLLVVHLILGGRRLREIDYLRDDPMVLRVMGLRRLPDVSTVSRTLAASTTDDVSGLRELVRSEVVHDLRREKIARVTLDFDGSVQSTKGRAEGSAVGYNPKKKGARSYYPLFCTVAQTGQFFDLHHRPGNVHDSNGAQVFMADCFERLWCAFDGALQFESRIDAAFFDWWTVAVMEGYDAQFTASVPFARLPELKGMIENRERWRRIDDEWSFFERDYRPKSWEKAYRFLFFRRRAPRRSKGPVQLDLFEPKSFDYEYKVVVTNKTDPAEAVLAFHHGRGSQEAIFGEAKSGAGLGVVCGKRLYANQCFTLCSMMAHNLGRTLQMRVKPKTTRDDAKRPALWRFEKLDTLCRLLIQRAGRLIRPRGRLTLSMSANEKIETDFLRTLDALEKAV
jgi:hypothetical protein